MKGQIAAENKNENRTEAVEEVRTGFYAEPVKVPDHADLLQVFDSLAELQGLDVVGAVGGLQGTAAMAAASAMARGARRRPPAGVPVTTWGPDGPREG